MKALLYIPPRYSLSYSVKIGFEEIGYETKLMNWENSYPKWRLRIEKYLNYFSPLKARLNKIFIDKINEIHLKHYLNESAVDIVFIYNHDYFLPKTLNCIKSHSKIIFFLGDNPMYSNTYDNNLLILKYADLIISPDSFWQEQLIEMGFKNIIFGNFSNISKVGYAYNNKTLDLLYLGYNHSYNWGFKKLLFLDQFSEFDLKIFGSGKGWFKWLPYFPKLEKKFIQLESRLSDNEYDKLLMSSKLLVIDLNPSYYNGFHIRFFEAISYGALPIMKNQIDLKKVFGDEFHVPTLNDFDDPKDYVNFYLENESIRIEKVKILFNYLKSNYTPAIVLTEAIKHLNV